MKLSSLLCLIAFYFLNSTSVFGQNGEQLFDDAFLHEIHFDMVDTTIIIANKEYQMVNVTIDGTAIDSIGFKKKGNISSFHGNNKFPFKIKTNKYVSGKKYDGIKEFTLHNNYQDPSMLREKMTYDLLEELGLHSLQAAFAKVFVNNEYWGLYTLLEAKDELYKRAFDNNDGAVLESYDFGDLCYEGPNQEDYYIDFIDDYIYVLDNGDETTAWERFPSMLDKANNTAAANYMEEVPNYLNVNDFFRYQAANVFLLNFDSYIGFRGNQLFYFDEMTQKWEVIPWDFNASFGLWNTNNHRPFDYPALPSIISNGCIASKINEVPELESTYFNTICELVNDLADTTRMINLRDQWRNQIEEAVYDDWRKEFDNATFDAATEYGYLNVLGESFVPAMKTFISDRWNFVNEELTSLGQDCASTATQDEIKNEVIPVFPNPTRDFLSIKWPNEQQEWQVEVIDLNGRSLLHWATKVDQVDVSSLPKGMYFLTLKSKEEQTTIKFAKVK